MAKLTIALPLVLPGVPSARDPCVARLGELLAIEGMEQVHVAPDDGQLCVHFDSKRFAPSDVRRVVQAAGAKISQRYRHETLRLDGMDCTTCATVIEHALGRVDGVLEASVSYAAELLRLEYDSEKTSRKAITQRLTALGYRVRESGRRESGWQRYRELILSLASGVLLLGGWLVGRLEGASAISLGLLIVAYGAGGFFTLRDAAQSLRAGRFEIDFLMIVAAAGAAALGEWAEGALLLFLFSLGHALEHLAMDRARHAIEALADLTPKTAIVIRDGTQAELRVTDLERGDRVIVKPGERIPADGQVAQGASAVNQAPVTGESVPVEKAVGALVFAGTINGEGALEIAVTKLASESTLSRMVTLVTEAQAQRSPTQQFVDRFERVFVPIVLAGAALLILVPPLFGMSWSEAFYRAMAVLVAASPCALAIATPAAVLAAVARAGQNGVLIKGGLHLESLGAVRAIAFDKTGTLTQGKPRVTDVRAFEGTNSDVLRWAAPVETQSAHPLARAVVAEAVRRNLVLAEASEVASVVGKGIVGQVSGRTVRVGSLAMFEQDALSVEVRAEVERFQKEGKTTMLVALDATIVGAIALADTLRPGVSQVLETLKRLGIVENVMLTGDNERVGTAIGAEAGVDTVRAELMPEDKVQAIEALLARHKTVAMVGDGVNDAPALARASVGIAMGGAGSDVALETADVALMSDELSKLPFAVALGRAARRVIAQNLWISLGVVVILIPATLFGWLGIGLAVLAHEGSTIVVVLNALRLLRFSLR